MTSREEVYAAVDSERAYQQSFWPITTIYKGDEAHVHSVGEELLLLADYIEQARRIWVPDRGNEATLHIVRKIAGIAVRCMEHHGAPLRKVQS